MSVLEPRLTSDVGLGFSKFSHPSYFCMWNFVSTDKAQLALSAGTKFHIQKCNTSRIFKENQSRALEVTLGSRTDTNLGHNHTKILKKHIGKIVFSNHIFSGST